MSTSEEELFAYTCLFCDEELKTFFYVCSRLHVSCAHCSSLGFCSKCHTIQVYCCGLETYEKSAKGPLFEKTGGSGPIVSLPDPDPSAGSEEFAPTTRDTNEIRQKRMFNCHDCGKFLSSARLTEHYEHEHPKIHICPLPPGGCLSFRAKLEDVPCHKIKRLQIIKLVKYKQLYSSDELNAEEGDKVLFIMATRVPYYKSKTALLVWLSSFYQGCSLTYSIEARGEMNNIASAMFTGGEVGSAVNLFRIEYGPVNYTALFKGSRRKYKEERYRGQEAKKQMEAELVCNMPQYIRKMKQYFAWIYRSNAEKQKYLL